MSQAYKAGDIIIDNCPAFVKILLNNFKDSRCKNCFIEAEGLKYCSKCRLSKYCGKKCQIEDWHNGHKLECKSKCFRECQTSVTVDFDVYLFRMYALSKLKPDEFTKIYNLHDGTTRCFNDLICHQESLAKNIAIRLMCEIMGKHIIAEDPKWKLDVDLLIRWIGMQRTNSFSIFNEYETCKIGFGIYIEPAILNHSCKPNAFYFINGTRLQIRAIEPISSGEQPHISYIPNHLHRTQRRKELQERYNFECHCEKCESGSDSGIDYERLNLLVNRMKTRFTEDDIRDKWEQIYAEHEEILGMFRQIYHEYDERITNQFCRAMTISAKLGVDKRLLRSLFEATSHHLLITYGEDNLDYQDFQKHVDLYF